MKNLAINGGFLYDLMMIHDSGLLLGATLYVVSDQRTKWNILWWKKDFRKATIVCL